MANPLVKFARGAAGAGAVLYADQYQQNTRADLMAKRDAVLEQYRQQAQTDAQTFSTQERVATQEFSANQAELDRTARAESPQAKYAGMQLEKAESEQALINKYREAKTPEERLEISKNLMAAQGKPIEVQILTGKRFLVAGGQLFDTTKQEWLKKPDNAREVTKMAAPVAKDLFNEQTKNLVEKGDPGYRTYEDFLKDVTDSITKVETGDATAPSGKYASPEDVRAAYKKGEISRSEAAKLLEQFE